MGTVHLRTRESLPVCGNLDAEHDTLTRSDRAVTCLRCIGTLTPAPRRCLTCTEPLPAHLPTPTHLGECEEAHDQRIALGQLPKTCGCTRTYYRASWEALPLVCSVAAPAGRAMGLEWRNCPCGSTLAVELESVDEQLLQLRALVAA